MCVCIIIIEVAYEKCMIGAQHFYPISEPTGPPHSRTFSCTVKVRGWEFNGSGSSKKHAKTAAAKAALSYLHSVLSIDTVAAKSLAFSADLGKEEGMV